LLPYIFINSVQNPLTPNPLSQWERGLKIVFGAVPKEWTAPLNFGKIIILKAL